MDRTRTLALLITAIAGAMVGFAACGGDDNEEQRTITVMLDWTPNTNHAGIYVAHARGSYHDEGLEVDIVEPGAGGVAQVVGSGTAEFGISVQESVIPAREAGIPVVSIAAIIQHNTSSLVALADEGINRPRDLEGKTYGGFGGALETEIIETLVGCDGGDPSTVEFVEVGNVDYLVGMERDQYDFVWLFEGWDVLRYRELQGEEVTTLPFIEYTNCIPDWYTPVIITSEDLIAEDPDLVRSFLAATVRGYEYAMENPEEAAQILVQAAPELNEDLVQLSAEYLATRYVEPGKPWGRQDATVWTRFEAFLREAGLISEQVEVEAAFTNEFLPGQ